MVRMPGMSGVLTAGQQQKIKDLVKLHHYALLIEVLGDKAVPKHIVTRVKSAGIYRKPRVNVAGQVLKRAFVFGKSGVLDPDVLTMKSKQFNRYLKKHDIKLSRDERASLDLMRRGFISHIETLANSMVEGLDKAILKADKKLHKKLARRARTSSLVELEKRKALSSIAKDLADTTRTQASNAARTIITETHNAYQDGRAQEIIRKSGDSDPSVFKRPRPDACNACVESYLETDGVTPKVFLMSELVDNGTNIGKSRGKRLPVVESHHPHCSCIINWLPPGFGFGKGGAMIYLGQATA